MEDLKAAVCLYKMCDEGAMDIIIANHQLERCGMSLSSHAVFISAYGFIVSGETGMNEIPYCFCPEMS